MAVSASTSGGTPIAPTVGSLVPGRPPAPGPWRSRRAARATGRSWRSGSAADGEPIERSRGPGQVRGPRSATVPAAWISRRFACHPSLVSSSASSPATSAGRAGPGWSGAQPPPPAGTPRGGTGRRSGRRRVRRCGPPPGIPRDVALPRRCPPARRRPPCPARYRPPPGATPADRVAVAGQDLRQRPVHRQPSRGVGLLVDGGLDEGTPKRQPFPVQPRRRVQDHRQRAGVGDRGDQQDGPGAGGACQAPTASASCAPHARHAPTHSAPAPPPPARRAPDTSAGSNGFLRSLRLRLSPGRRSWPRP